MSIRRLRRAQKEEPKKQRVKKSVVIESEPPKFEVKKVAKTIEVKKEVPIVEEVYVPRDMTKDNPKEIVIKEVPERNKLKTDYYGVGVVGITEPIRVFKRLHKERGLNVGKTIHDMIKEWNIKNMEHEKS